MAAVAAQDTKPTAYGLVMEISPEGRPVRGQAGFIVDDQFEPTTQWRDLRGLVCGPCKLSLQEFQALPLYHAN